MLVYKKLKFNNMKKMIAFLAMTSLFFVGCKKDAPIVETIVRTDDPPRDMFETNQYSVTYKVFVEATDVDKAIKQGYYCNYDQNGRPYDCGDYYKMPAKKYWGFYKGQTYVSQNWNWYILRANTLLDAQNAIRKKDAAIGYWCNGCQNPFNADYISGIEQ